MWSQGLNYIPSYAVPYSILFSQPRTFPFPRPRVVVMLHDEAPPDPCRELSAFLDREAPLVTSEQIARQAAVLKRLHALFRAWVGRDVTFRMLVAGSYRLGIHTSGADIDVVFVIAPAVDGVRGVTRDRVFAEFVPLLVAAEGVTDVQPVATARVPLIGCYMDGQELDIMTCHAVPGPTPLPPAEVLLREYEWLNGVDEASVLAFSGPRVTALLLSLTQPNTARYLVALRFVRLWAKRRAVYGNRDGYLGGVNLALLMCYVVLRCPASTTAPELVRLFFTTFAGWHFHPQRPVRVDTITEAAGPLVAEPPPCPVWLAHMEWQPTSKVDHMVVLTPCFPRSNSTFSASENTIRVMRQELQRAAAVLARSPHDWQAVLDACCRPCTALARCNRVLAIRVTAPNDACGKTWLGFVKAQTRHLVQLLSRQELAIADFRYMPGWHAMVAAPSPQSHAAGSSPTPLLLVEESYIVADDDGVARTYLVKGSIAAALDYFLTAYILTPTAPTRPEGGLARSSVEVEYKPRHALAPSVFPGNARAELLAHAALEAAEPLLCAPPRPPVLPPTLRSPSPSPSRLRPRSRLPPSPSPAPALPSSPSPSPPQTSGQPSSEGPVLAIIPGLSSDRRIVSWPCVPAKKRQLLHNSSSKPILAPHSVSMATTADNSTTVVKGAAVGSSPRPAKRLRLVAVPCATWQRIGRQVTTTGTPVWLAKTSEPEGSSTKPLPALLPLPMPLASAPTPALTPTPTLVRVCCVHGQIRVPFDVYIGHPWKGLVPYPGLECRVPRRQFACTEQWLAACRRELEQRAAHDVRLRSTLLGLSGRALACWCAPEPCHGQAIQQVHDALHAVIQRRWSVPQLPVVAPPSRACPRPPPGSRKRSRQDTR